MIVTVAIVRMMEMAIDQVVHVAAVGHSLVSAAVPMTMATVVSRTGVPGRTSFGIARTDFEGVLVPVVVVPVMEMAVVQVVDVTVVLNSGVPAAGGVAMRVLPVRAMLWHRASFAPAMAGPPLWDSNEFSSTCTGDLDR